MGQLLYPTKKAIKGPWIISKNDFEELDKIVKLIDNLLEKSLDIEVKETVLSENEKNNLSEQEVTEKIAKAKQSIHLRKRANHFS